MSSRDDILTRLRASVRPEAPPPPWRSRRDFRDLRARFTEALTAAKGEVHQASSLEAAWGRVRALLLEMDAVRVVINGDCPLPAGEAIAAPAGVDWHLVGRSDGDLRAVCAAADVGISGAEAGLAETGSLVISSGPTQARQATLLPPVHIGLLATDQLTTDVFTWLAARDGVWPANTVLVSGPSKTGDIEQTMAVGVHGPKRFVVVLYEVA